jgi:hypothetical protein
VTTLIGVLLAVLTDRIRELRGAYRWWNLRIWALGLTVALVPIAPTPLTAVYRNPVPAYITQGGWRPYLANGGTIIPVPLPSERQSEALRWAAQVHQDFAFPLGYFLSPFNAEVDGIGVQLPPETGTALIFDAVSTTGVVPAVTDVERRRVYDDLRRWQGAIIVLAADEPNAVPLLETLRLLVGPGELRGDAWVWDVRSITGVAIKKHEP